MSEEQLKEWAHEIACETVCDIGCEPRTDYQRGLVLELEMQMLYAMRKAVAAEREACCRDVCEGCAKGMPLEFAERPDGGVRDRPPTWIHWWGFGVWTVCGAAAIHARAGEGEQVPTPP